MTNSMNPKKLNPGKSLAELNPGLAKQWHQTKNEKLTPYDVTPNSNKRVWWKCLKVMTMSGKFLLIIEMLDGVVPSVQEERLLSLTVWQH